MKNEDNKYHGLPPLNCIGSSMDQIDSILRVEMLQSFLGPSINISGSRINI